MHKAWVILLIVCLNSAGAPVQVERQAENLRTVLQQADEAYYNQARSVMSDAVYDQLLEQYECLLSTYPELAKKTAVGAAVVNPDDRAEHTHPVLSLEKAYSDDQLAAFVTRNGENASYCVAPKIDGLTVVLRYEKGFLVQALTRGDGQNGLDVTRAVLASGAVPLRLNRDSTLWIVRGEMFMPTPAFAALNRRRAEGGQSLLKSPRNTAAGTLRLDDSVEISQRGIAFAAFELVHADSRPPTHAEALLRMQAAGIPVVDSQLVSGSDVLPAVQACHEHVRSMHCDGVVIKLNEVAAFDRLGATAHHPRGAIARKYRQTPVETRLLRVEWTTGATGKRTPVAHFEPVEINGATVQKASLHNEARIRAMDLKRGDWIQVIRAGGSVPEIIGNLPARRTGAEQEIPGPAE